MITKQDILERSAEWQLRPEVVEKDYVLGWVLTAIGTHAETADRWVFKGGTCLKKCYFETYRFSEDLDFSLLPEAAYTKDGLAAVLADLAQRARQASGIEFPPEAVSVRERKDLMGRTTFQGKVAYRGPLGIPSAPRILLDLTRHEPILDTPVKRRVFDPYGDLPEAAAITAYSFDELLAEKTRALYERTRPRDLYDIVHILENRPEAVKLDRVRDLLRKKFEVKKIAPPSASEIVTLVRHSEELRSEWANILARQLPQLPPLEALAGRIDALLAWIDAPVPLPVAATPSYRLQPGEELVAPPGMVLWRAGPPLEVVRFAGANRLLINFRYKGKERLAEPYSLRRPATGNLLLYVWERASNQIKAFKVLKIENLRVTDVPFVPRYRVEFTASGPLHAPPVRRTPRDAVANTALTRKKGRSRALRAPGPTYIFACLRCQKEFRRSRNDPGLRKHKSSTGWGDCPPGRGYLIRIE